MVNWVSFETLQCLISGLIMNRWGYLTNLTLIGHAIYMSMDIPDAFLAVRFRSECVFHDLTYAVDSSPSCLITWDGIDSKWAPLQFSSSHGRKCFSRVYFPSPTPSVTSGIGWTSLSSGLYGLSLILSSTCSFTYRIIDLPVACSESNRVWAPETGAWLVWWMKYQLIFPISLLQLLNLFWYYLILRIVIRSYVRSLYLFVTHFSISQIIKGRWSYGCPIWRRGWWWRWRWHRRCQGGLAAIANVMTSWALLSVRVSRTAHIAIM